MIKAIIVDDEPFCCDALEISKYIRAEGGYLIMTDNSSIDVSRSRKELLMEKLQQTRL